MVAARQTVLSGTASPAPRCRAAPPPVPRVCYLVPGLGWRSCDSGAHRRGGGCAVLLDLGVLAIYTDAGRPAPSPLPAKRSSQHSAPPALRANAINTNNGVRERGQGSSAVGWGRGQEEAECVRVYMLAHPFLVSRWYNIEAIVQNMCPCSPPGAAVP